MRILVTGAAGFMGFYISDTGKAKREFGWKPKVSKEEGVKRLYEWMKEELS